MAQSCSIETLDRSGRWYLTPGAKSIYDLRVRNDANSTIDCSLILDDPVSGVSVEPTRFPLRGHEVRTVTLTVAADAPVPRSQRVLLTLRDGSGAQLATFEHPLIITGGSDCNVSLAWKDALVEQGAVKGFELTCSVRSQSDGPTSFALSFTPHPSLTFDALEPLNLGPGESKELTIPVRWNSTVKDTQGCNHPTVLEVGVPVSNGRRWSRLRWDAIETQLQQFYWNDVLATVRSAPAATNGEKIANAESGGQMPPEHPGAASAAVATRPSEAKAPEAMPVEAAAAQASSSNGASNSAANGHAKVHLPDSAAEEIGLPLFSDEAPQAPAIDEAPQASAIHEAPAATLASSHAGAPRDAAPLTPPPLVTPPAFGVSAMRKELHPHSKKRIPPGLLIGALATVSLAIAAVFFRPPSTQPAPSTGPIVLASPLAAGSFQPQPATAPPPSQDTHQHLNHPARPAAPKTPRPDAQPRPQVSALMATPAPRQVAHALPPPRRNVAQIVVQPVRHPAAAPAPRRSQLAAAPSGPVVALGGVEAFYGASGRAVRVNWSAAEQSAANVQLIDNHGTTVNSITVRGGRRSVLLYLPPRYRGAVTVQLTSTGRLGERVAQTAFLPPFGN
ncbi:MAG: hypothetical protein M3Z37_01035 [Candidatus Eremiobacteraeota bacterium]|nr:hypothetical protein [Candidatus Eremiobacteraeota bacterium]